MAWPRARPVKRPVCPDIPCRYLDVETNLCTVYDRRQVVNLDCLGVEEGARRGVFPADCPYVRDIPGYRPPLAGLGPDEIAALLEGVDAEEVET